MEREGEGRLFRAEPLATRRHPGPPRPATAEQLWTDLCQSLPSPPDHWQRDRLDADAALRSRLDGRAPSAMSPEAACRVFHLMVEAEFGDRADPWCRRGARERAFGARVSLFARWLVASRGGVAAICAADLVRLARGDGRSPACRSAWHDPFALGFRDALTGAPEAEFTAARDAALALAEGQGWAVRAFFAFLLADDGPTPHALRFEVAVAEAVREGADPTKEAELVPLLAELRPSTAVGWRGQRRGFVLLGAAQVDPARLAATVSAVAARHGEPAVPTLFWLYRQAKGDDEEVLAKAMLETREDDAVARLMPDLHRRPARAALGRAAALYPAWTLGRCLGLLAAGRGGPAMEHRVREMVARHGADAGRRWCAGLDASAAARLEALLAAPLDGLASDDALPAFLRNPPWRAPARPALGGPVLRLRVLPTPFACRPARRPEVSEVRRGRAIVVASTGDLSRMLAAAAAGPHRDLLLGAMPFAAPLPDPGAPDGEVLSWLAQRLDQMEASGAGCSVETLYAGLHAGLERQPEALALMLWNRGGLMLRGDFYAFEGRTSDPAPFVLERLGAAAVPGVVRLLEADPLRGWERFGAVEAAEIAPIAARTLKGDAPSRGLALSWLMRHPTAAATGLLPPALGAPGAARDEAGRALRRICARSPARTAAVQAVVERYAVLEPRAAVAAAAVLDRDPLLDGPRGVLEVPSWFVPGHLVRPVLKGGGALPDAAMSLVAEMLAFSTRDDVYAGIGELKRCCTADSLGAFAWDLFSAWLARGGPGQSVWAVRAIGWLGDDACARRLVTVIRRWLDMKARPQAAMGIEALADIGSDAALVQLAGLAERLGSKSLRAKAARHLDEVAEARGLSAEALADRIAPDLGLDARGGLDLDFGARHFRASLGGKLKPVLRDAAGRALRDLPRPGKADDRERAAAAAALWSALKRDARAAAGLQVARLEAMLAEARRVTPDVFRACFAEQPFVGHLARRLVWARFSRASGVAPTAFMVALDGAFVDPEGALLAIDRDDAAAMIGLAHPLDLPPAAWAAWRLRLARLDLAQPFPQVDRDVYLLTAAERRSSSLHRVRDVRVEAGWLRGAVARGWIFERPREEALMWSIGRRVVLADGSPGRMCLDFAPGLRVGTPDPDEGPRTLAAVELFGTATDRGAWPVMFDALDAVAASEAIRSVLILAGRGSHPTSAEWADRGGERVSLQ